MTTTGAHPRFAALQEANHRQARTFDWAKDKSGNVLRVPEIYGINTFSAEVMKDMLSKKMYTRLQEIIAGGGKLERAVADEVALAVKQWAIENGATHFCHWFQPQTGGIAEKHDAFLDFDDEGNVLERFSGSQLIQSEPDASSFPSGGMRSTFEARGYTAWDSSSPIFIMEKPTGKTLCIPAVFISYYGQALDQKTPLLRSLEVLNTSALKVLKLFGNNSAKRVTATVGVEQEYFLIDRAFYALRPDLVASSRTLLGSKPPKGQELEDHYFGSIKGRVQAFMNEVEYELYRLGIPIKTRHNEVAPSQFEIAPIYEQASVAADHNQLVMEIMRSVARRHDFALLLHEKPFAGVNGSGKHNNWSVQDSDGNNLLNPGQTPAENLQFLVFLMAVLKAVHKRAGLLRMSVASSGNDHRLGANEAPPAIISVFLGEQLSAILDTIEKGTVFRESGDNQVIALGISQLPAVQRDNTDRNRTSPFAFTGNKFEFRAVGSSASISLPMTILNAAVAEALDDITTTIQTRMGDGTNFRQAVVEVVRQAVVDTKAIHFDGNGYAEEWVAEAERRGLPNLRKTPEALAQMVTPESIAFFKQTGVYSDNEAEARYHVQLERYIKDTEIEIEALRDIAQTQILPAAFQHQAILADAVGELLDVLHLETSDPLAQAQTATLRACAEAIQQLHSALATLAITTTAMHHIEDAPAKAVHVASEVIPALGHIRAACDELEGIVADSLWPLPKYRELLFIS